MRGQQFEPYSDQWKGCLQRSIHRFPGETLSAVVNTQAHLLAQQNCAEGEEELYATIYEAIFEDVKVESLWDYAQRELNEKELAWDDVEVEVLSGALQDLQRSVNFNNLLTSRSQGFPKLRSSLQSSVDVSGTPLMTEDVSTFVSNHAVCMASTQR